MMSSVSHRDLRLKITCLSIVVCFCVLLANGFEYFTQQNVFKLGMVVVMMLNITCFVLSLIVDRFGHHHRAVLLFLAVGPITFGGVLFCEAPSLALTISAATLALLMFLPDVFADGRVSHRRWLMLLGFAGITSFALRIIIRGPDFASTLPERLVAVFGSLSLLMMLWLAVQMILTQLSDALIRSEELRRQLELSLSESEMLSRTLAEKGEELQRISDIKTQFLANMSHELRTPLNAVIGYSEMVIEDLEDADQSDQSWYDDVLKINKSGTHLLAMVSDILDVSKVESGQVQLEFISVSVTALCADLEQAVRPLIAKKNNTFEVDIQLDADLMTTDRTRIYQVLLNLLGNAAKFTSEGDVVLRVQQGQAQGSVRFCVEDNGIGIASEHIEHIFDAFTQVDASSTRLYGGTGLGLSLVREFACLLGGQVGVESALGAGSLFWVELPVHSKPSLA